MTTTACSPAHHHHHHHGPGAHHQHGGGPAHNHGNPEDFDSYLAHLEAPDRAEWQKPDEVVSKLGLAKGAVACEIGAGPGYFSLRLARAVGETGVVYAVDVEQRMIDALRDRAAKAGVRNVVPVIGQPEDPMLQAGRCDVVLIVNTLHHFTDPAAYLKRLVPALKPGGRIVNIDFHKRESPMGPPLEMRIDRAEFVSMAERAGLQVSAEHGILPYQYFIEVTPP